MAIKKYTNYSCEMGVGRWSWSAPSDIDDYRENIEDFRTPEWEMVKRCKNTNAWVVKDLANGTVCLQSYRTVVSMQVGDETVDFAKYSSTTTRHQGWFRVWVRNH